RPVEREAELRRPWMYVDTADLPHARPTPVDPARAFDRRLLTRPQRAGLRVALWIGAGLAIMAVFIGALVFDTRLLGVGAIIAFAFMALFGASVWLASVEDAAEHDKA